MIENISSQKLLSNIRAISKKEGIPPQQLLKKYFLDCFLFTIQQSQYKQYFIVKGGMLFSALTGISTRTTIDIDFCIKVFPLEPKRIEITIRDICAISQSDNIQFIFNRIENIRDNGPYGGYRIFINVIFESIKEVIKLEISSGDIITPGPIQEKFSILGSDIEFDVLSYNIETLFAEKIETILSRGESNTRLRDFYDIFIIGNIFRSKVNKEIFKQALNVTLETRGSEEIINNFAKIISTIQQSSILEKAWGNYQRKTPYAKQIKYSDTIQTLIEWFEIFQTPSS